MLRCGSDSSDWLRLGSLVALLFGPGTDHGCYAQPAVQRAATQAPHHVRQHFQLRTLQVTAAHGEAKTAYMKAQDGHEARLAGLEEQVSELQAAVDEVSCRHPAFHASEFRCSVVP